MEKIGIIGSGTWGTAISILLHNNGHEVTIWSAIPEEIDEMAATRKHKNLPEVTLPESLRLTKDLKEAMEGKDLLVMAVPSVFVRSTAKRMKPYLHDGQIIVDVAKGIEESTLFTMSQIIEEELPTAQVAALSGPSHAEEVSRGLPTTCVAGAHKKAVAEYIQSVFMSPVFRVYTSPDMLGIEIGAALKNVVALAAGIADGLGYGDNTKAALITRGMAEIARLGMAMGGKYQSFAGLSGIGDLIVTCASMHSRNRRAGILIGKGYSMEEAMKEVQMVVEGVYSAKAAMALAKKYEVPMPIVEQVNRVLFEGMPASEAVSELMLRDKRIENSDLPWEE
jgi:glycerol-3-phosphate dehydrogenase (NAD(P)+)